MNSAEAKHVLSIYRPGSNDADDPEVSEALAQLQRDPDLQAWFEKQLDFQTALRESFRQIPVSDRNIVPQPAEFGTELPQEWWRQSGTWAAAAAVLVLLTLGFILFRPSHEPGLATFRSRMVRTSLREYRMDIQTNDLAQIRRFLAEREAPSDFELPSGLAQLPAIGAGRLSWQGNGVAMVCLEASAQSMLFLFVADQTTVGQPPSETPEFTQVNKLMTATWSQSGWAYVLAGPGTAEDFQKLLAR